MIAWIQEPRRLLALIFGVLGAMAPALADADFSALKKAYRRPATIPFPANNLYSPEKAALGKTLFFDTRLSRDQNLNCASCHNPSYGWEVPLAKAIGAGAKPLERNAPSVVNRAWTTHLFWDGRAEGLEAQARGPIESKMEMDAPMATVVQRLKMVSDYQIAFDRAFPGEGISETNVLKAIATYERILVSPKAPFDRWVDGDEQAISNAAKRGFELFNGKALCVACHPGWSFSDNKFHDIGLPSGDLGRFAVTQRAADKFAMKTPSLREISVRAPYMHDGSLPTLESVVAHYASGGIQRPTLSPVMKPLSLSGPEQKDLVEFMRSLTSKAAVTSMPNLPVH